MLVDRITEVLQQDGWTCEYHEPVSGPGECSQCDDAHRRTAERVVAELNLTEEALAEKIAAIPDLVAHRFIDTDGEFSVKIHSEREVAERVAKAWISGWAAVEDDRP